MVFTDRELEQLKDVISHNVHLSLSASPGQLEALLARLEAAEKALKFSLDEDEIVSGKMFEDAYSSWLKSAGR